MIASEVARFIIDIEEHINPDSLYYGKLVKWWEQDNDWHYGIGLSNTHFFNLGTKNYQQLQLLKRHEIDIRDISEVVSSFDSDEIIERLKYALRWLKDLPEISDIKRLNGRSLAFLIYTNNQRATDHNGKPNAKEIKFNSYLKQNAPQLKHSKVKDFFEKGKNWVYIFLFCFGLVLAFLGLIPGFESSNLLIKWGSRLLIVFLSALVLSLICVLISTFKWSGLQKKNFWDWLQLLIVPLMLAFGAFYIDSAAETRGNRIAEEQRQQELLKDYFTKMQTLIIETEKSKNSNSSNKNPVQEQTQPNNSQSSNKNQVQAQEKEEKQADLLPAFQPIAQALTLAILDELDGKRKGKVIVYLAESKYLDKHKPTISLTNANLKNIVLQDVNLENINLVEADMTKANLTRVTFKNANLKLSIFSHAILDDVKFFENNILQSLNFDGATLKNIKFSENINVENPCFSKLTKVKYTENTEEDGLILLKNINDLRKAILFINVGEECNSTIINDKQNLDKQELEKNLEFVD